MRGGKDDSDQKVTYMCETCHLMFFSYDRIAEHKAMTGHGSFVEKKRI